jgi:hypothetical protein
MADHNGYERWSLALTCRKGHRWEPDLVTVSWAPCDCSITGVDPGCGHLVVHCRQSRCAETEQTDADAPIGADGDGALRSDADRDGPQAAGVPGTAWTLLLQAYEHQKCLLRPSHPSAADIVVLRSWIRDCVEVIDEARRLEALIGRGGEIAHVEGLAARVTAVVDAFQMYTSMLERFRRTHQAVMLPPPQSQPLAAVADDERVLLGCRAAVRRSMQQLIAALQADHAGRA